MLQTHYIPDNHISLVFDITGVAFLQNIGMHIPPSDTSRDTPTPAWLGHERCVSKNGEAITSHKRRNSSLFGTFVAVFVSLKSCFGPPKMTLHKIVESCGDYLDYDASGSVDLSASSHLWDLIATTTHSISSEAASISVAFSTNVNQCTHQMEKYGTTISHS